jgi:hypothetical protein
LSRANADKLREEIEAKEEADRAHKAAMKRKKKEQAHKKAQEKAEKEERAVLRAQAKETRDTHTEMARMGRVDRRFFE